MNAKVRPQTKTPTKTPTKTTRPVPPQPIRTAVRSSFKAKVQEPEPPEADAQELQEDHDVVVPDGWTVIGRPPTWDPEELPVLIGTRGETHSQIMDRGTKRERTQRNFVIETDDGLFTVWESSRLRDLFDQTRDGQRIRIEFNGYGEAQKGMAPPKLFTCMVEAVENGEEDEDEDDDK